MQRTKPCWRLKTHERKKPKWASEIVTTQMSSNPLSHCQKKNRNYTFIYLFFLTEQKLMYVQAPNETEKSTLKKNSERLCVTRWLENRGKIFHLVPPNYLQKTLTVADIQSCIFLQPGVSESDEFWIHSLKKKKKVFLFHSIQKRFFLVMLRSVKPLCGETRFPLYHWVLLFHRGPWLVRWYQQEMCYGFLRVSSAQLIPWCW